MRPETFQRKTFQRIQAVFHEALQHDADRRTAYVEATCADDPGIAGEVMSLLEYEDSGAAAGTQRPFALAEAAFDAAEGGSLIGASVGRFRIEAVIGSGGMGRVFKARRTDADVDQVVALKLIRREMFNASLLRRFSAERKILASLNHPGIAHLIDAGTDEQGVPYVAMEYVDGLPLPDYCARHALPLCARIELFRAILAAVSYAHRNLVIHRDLKPANVLVTAEGRPKLLDFGIAKALDPDEPQTATGDRFFTLTYAAPELLLGRNAGVACDVYALGAMLYELLAGVPPFDLKAAGAADIERTILMVPPQPLRAAVKRDAAALSAPGIDSGIHSLPRWIRELEGDLESIVQKALRKEPESRYASVDQFDEDLLRYLERRPVAASGAGKWYRMRKFCARNALAVSFSALFVAVASVGMVHVMRQNAEIRVERDRAQTALAILRDAFRSADPARLEAGDTRARAILSSAAREVLAMERRQPAVFRELAYQIGGIQLNLGLTKEGLALVQRANRSLPPASDAGALLEIRGLIMAGRNREARALIEARRTVLGALPEFLAEEGHLLYLEERHAQAAAMLERLLSSPGVAAESMLRDRAYLYLAETHRTAGHPDRALKVLDRQVREQGDRYGPQHPIVLISRLRRVELLSATGAAETGERELIALKPLLDRSYDAGSAVQGEYHHSFGQLLNAQNRGEDALRHFRQALEADLVALGPDHENTLRDHLNIAITIAYGATDRSAAYPHFAQAIAGIEKTKGAGASLAGFSRLEAAKAHYWDRDLAAARRVLTPTNAPVFFPAMAAVNRGEYLAALHFGFGPQDCTSGWEQRMGVASSGASLQSDIAHRLICSYDPKGAHRPSG